jgi:hypothetical protein
MRRFPFAFLLVGLLGLLAAGGAVLGAFQAPTGTNLAVHNDAGETLLAEHLSGSYSSTATSGTVISFRFTSPDRLYEVARGPSGTVEGKRTVTGASANAVLGPLRQLLSIPQYSAKGSTYHSSEPASVLVPPAQRQFVTGTYRTTVELAGGYVVGVVERIDASEHGQHIVDEVTYRLDQVDSWTRPHP